MVRANWKTAEGRKEATIEGAKGNAVIQRKRDKRKAEAIALHASGLTVNEIKTKLGISRRTVKRYLETEEGIDIGIGDIGYP